MYVSEQILSKYIVSYNCHKLNYNGIRIGNSSHGITRKNDVIDCTK